MKNKIVLFVFLITAFVLPSQATLTGYISLDFVKGQGQSEMSSGSFRNSQAGLVFFGDITPGVSYLTEINLKPEGTFDLMQALISLGSTEKFSMKMGLYTVPFGRYNQSNRPHQTILINPPLNVERMYPSLWKDVGILLEGRTRRFFYSAFLGNGLSENESLAGGQQFKDNNKDKGMGGRLGLVLSQGFEMAFSYYKGKYDNDNSRDLSLQGIDLFWYLEGILVHSEYSRALMDVPGDRLNVEGFFVQVAVDWGQLWPVVCYQRLDYEDSFHGPGFISPSDPGDGIFERKRRWAFGVIYNAAQNLLLKLEYDLNREVGIELEDNSLSVQVAFSF